MICFQPSDMCVPKPGAWLWFLSKHQPAIAVGSFQACPPLAPSVLAICALTLAIHDAQLACAAASVLGGPAVQ